MSWGTQVLRLMALILAGYVAVCLLLFLRQRQMLYHPGRVSEGDMLASARAAGLLRWLDANGAPIGWMTADGSISPPILILQGNAGNALNRAGLVARLRRSGIKARFFILDYPGYGSRAGSPSQASLTEAAVSALDALPAPAVLLGESLGTGVAAQAAARRPDRVSGLILVTPFDSMARAAAHHYPWLPVGWLLLDRFDSVDAFKNFSKPIAVIVAELDETVPAARGRRLVESLHVPKKLWVVRYAGHNDATDILSDQAWRDVWHFVVSSKQAG